MRRLFVSRTRTATNEVGEVVRANYGRIGEKLNLAIGLCIKTWFNSTPNDTNLEDSRTAAEAGCAINGKGYPELSALHDAQPREG